jgi:hypothetical protein
VPLKKLADDVFVFLRAATFGLGFISEPRGFELMQFLAAFFAFPRLLSAQIGLEGFDFAQDYLDRVVERFDDVGRRFFAVEDVGWHAQGERGCVQRLFRMPFKDDQQVNGVRRKMFEVFFELGDLLSQLFAEQSVNLKVLGDEVSRKCGEAGHS